MLTVQRKRIDLEKGMIGLVSDTHGLVRPEALAALRGCELIIHAGDIGKPEVLDAFGGIAKLVAIRGNNDRESWAKKFPDVLDLRINGFKLHVIHNVQELELDPVKKKIHAVISGHSHKPATTVRDGIHFINPGSAGPRRFKLPIAVGKLSIKSDKVEAKIIELRS